jgi:hypothetical protein
MHDIHISDPAWRTTFPHLVAHYPMNGSPVFCCVVMKGISGAAGRLLGMSYVQKVRDQP